MGRGGGGGLRAEEGDRLRSYCNGPCILDGGDITPNRYGPQSERRRRDGRRGRACPQPSWVRATGRVRMEHTKPEIVRGERERMY